MVKRIWYWFTRYRLRDDEYVIWLSIVGKAKKGFREWHGKILGDYNYLGGPWISNLSMEESLLINKIYRKFDDDEGRIITALLSPNIAQTQEDYIKFSRIKHKVYH